MLPPWLMQKLLNPDPQPSELAKRLAQQYIAALAAAIKQREKK
jgi:hypothetical protein